MIDYLKTVDTPTLSNAIELLNVRPRSAGFTPLQIQCQFPELGRMVGYAVTAHVETVTQLEPADRHRFIDLYEALDKSPKPGVIAFQEVGGHGDLRDGGQRGGAEHRAGRVVWRVDDQRAGAGRHRPA